MATPNKSAQDLMVQCTDSLPVHVNDQSYDEFLQSLHIRSQSVRGQLFRMAVSSSTDVRFHKFLDMALHQESSKGSAYRSFAWIARHFQISQAEFEAFWLNAKANRAKFKVMDRIDELTDKLYDYALGEDVTCPTCDGCGMVQREGKPDKTCPECYGKGTIHTNSELAKESIKTLIKMSGLVKEEPTVVINQDMRSVGLDSMATKLADIPFDLDVRKETE